MEKAKHVRRAAKGTLTRTLNAGNMLLEAKRPMQEVREVFEGLKPPTRIWLPNMKHTRCSCTMTITKMPKLG